MILKIAGITSIAVGIAALVFAANLLVGARDASEILATVLDRQGTTFDPSDWLLHWRLNSVAIGIAGSALIVAGVASVLGHPWALVMMSVVLALLAVLPWVLQVLGLARYAFESPSGLESAVFSAVAVAAAVLYRQNRHAV